MTKICICSRATLALVLVFVLGACTTTGDSISLKAIGDQLTLLDEQTREVMATAVLGYASCMSDSSFCEYSRKELEKIQDTRARGEEAARERAAFARARITFRARKGLKPDEAIYAPTVENMRIANNPTPVNPDFCE